MLTLNELEIHAKLLNNRADSLSLLSRSLRGNARAHVEGQVTALHYAADQIRQLNDAVINDAADWFADQDLGEMKLEAAERADADDYA